MILEEDVLVGAKREPRRLFLFSDLLIVTRTCGRVERLGDPVYHCYYYCVVLIFCFILVASTVTLCFIFINGYSKIETKPNNQEIFFFSNSIIGYNANG